MASKTDHSFNTCVCFPTLFRGLNRTVPEKKLETKNHISVKWYFCTCACTYACMCSCEDVCPCVGLHVYTQAYIRARQLAHSRTRIRIHTCARRLLATAPCTLHPEGLRETARAGPARGSHDLRQNLSFRNLGQSPHTPHTTSTPPPNTRGRSPNPHPPPPPTRFNRGKGGGSGKYEDRRCETVALTPQALPTFCQHFF